MKRLIVTGAGGFLGSNVISGVLTDSFFDEIIAVTLGANQMKSRFQENTRLRIFEADAIATGEVKLNGEDLILNCAYPRAMKGSDVTLGLNYVESIFQAAALFSVKGIVNISSQSVYDRKRNNPAVETDLPVLEDEYAIGKYCMEMLLRNVCRTIPYTNIRLASLIGPGFDVRVPNKMVKFAIERGEITAEINEQKFGYLDVEDAVRGLIRILKMDPGNWKYVYNVGGEETYTLVDIAENIVDILKDEYGKQISLNLRKGNAVLNSALDDSLVRSDIGNYKLLNLKQSILKIISKQMEKTTT